jgi:hypothetical protein
MDFGGLSEEDEEAKEERVTTSGTEQSNEIEEDMFHDVSTEDERDFSFGIIDVSEERKALSHLRNPKQKVGFF